MSSDTTQQLRTIRLLGDLGRRFGRVHRLAVATPAEAVRALCVLRRGFREHMDTRERSFRMTVRGAPIVDWDSEPHMRRPPDAEIVIAPVLRGAKSKWAGIALGVIIVAAAFATGGASLTATGGLAFSGMAGQIAFQVGVSMVLGGLAQLLAPTPKLESPSDGTTAGYRFGGAVQTSAQGYPVPIGYGELMVGGAQISTGAWSEDIPV